MKDEWEVTCIKFPSSVPSKKISMGLSSVALSEDQDSDTYCYELLSMLLGLSQSDVGCGFLSEQSILVSDLFTLLHVASLRIQLQVRKLLPFLPSPLLEDVFLSLRVGQCDKYVFVKVNSYCMLY